MKMLNIYIVVPSQCVDRDMPGEVSANSQRVINEDDDVKVLFFQHND
ncbi:MAG: hypothetical protein JXB49_15775 [Bacteroidales bacterium]|nr:hypothetical protein [Bacteroidales bacterium]